MGALIDLTGNHYGLLTVIRRDTHTSSTNAKWICKCQCGNIKSISGCALRNGKTRSCGCQMYVNRTGINKTHGMTQTRIYQEWLSMKRRCSPSSSNSKTYYNRGITVCDEWQTSFQAFYDWAMQNGYNDSLTIDRINNDLGYEPSNCRWIDIRLQQGNKSNTVKVMYHGKEYCLRTLCMEIGFPYKLAHERYLKLLRKNQPIDTDILFAPKQRQGRIAG